MKQIKFRVSNKRSLKGPEWNQLWSTMMMRHDDDYWSDKVWRGCYDGGVCRYGRGQKAPGGITLGCAPAKGTKHKSSVGVWIAT